MPSEVLEPSIDGLPAFVDALPKVELHVHLEGSIAPSTLLALARSQPDSTLPRSKQGLRELYRFRDFAHFLEVYLLICRHLRSAEDFALITRELGASLAAQNVRYAEITVTPIGHVPRGVAPEALFEGIEQGRAEVEAEHGVWLRWCTDIDGGGGPELAVETVELVLRHRPAGLVSLGLGGEEVPRAQFGRAFEIAQAAGLHSVPHAGEAAGRSRSGTRSTGSGPSASAMASAASKTLSWSLSCADGASPWRSARPRTCAPGWSPTWRRIRCHA
jgi:aminodeoxyfutalosine deaminase